MTLALGCVLFAAPAYLAAQQDQDQDSVADAARKAQAEKKTAPKAKMTIDNDNLGTLTGAVNVVGDEPAPAKQDAFDDKTPKTDKAAVKKDEAYWREQFAVANKKLADDAHELDIMQREYNLKQQQFYTDPTAALKQEYSRQDLNDSKAKNDDMTAVVAQDKADISNLEDQLRQAGGDPGWETPPAQPASAEPGAAGPAPAEPAPAGPAPAPQP